MVLREAVDRATRTAARRALGWAADHVQDSTRPWVEGLRGELVEIDGGVAQLLWALGGLVIVFNERRRLMARQWLSWSSVLSSSTFGLALGLVLIVGIVWTNVIAPSYESDSEYQWLYLLIGIFFMIYFGAAGFVASRRRGTVIAG